MFLLEAASPEEKKEWIAALWTNVFYANPAKRHCGVAYTVELQVRHFTCFRISMRAHVDRR